MQNFDFFNPTHIIFGEGKVAELDSLVPAHAKVLILFGGQSARKNGTLDEVRAALGNRTVSEFGGIEANPCFETLMGAVEKIKAEQIDFLLAVGGGSVIDGTKFVAAAVHYAGEPKEMLYTFGAHIGKVMPFGTVLTLPATGSEMNENSVVTIKAEGAKLPIMNRKLYPIFSILDPTKTYTLPERQLANGVVDSFVHIMEQYLTFPAGGYVQDRFAEGLLLTLVEHGPEAVRTKDYTARANLVWTATLALNGLIGAGVPQDWATHMIGHEMTARYGIDHARTLAVVLPARTLAVVLPAMLEVRKAEKHAKLLQYATRVWQITEGSEAERIEQAIARTRTFFESLGLPTRLSSYDIGSDGINAIIQQLEAHGMVALGEHQNVSPDVCRKVLELAL